MGTHVDGSQAGLLDTVHFVLTPRALGDAAMLVLGALEAKHVFARNHPPVNQDRLVALVAIVNHRVHHLDREINIVQTSSSKTQCLPIRSSSL